MEDQLNRRMIVAVLAFVPLLLLLLVGSRFHPPLDPDSPAALQAAEIAALPGNPGDVPVFGTSLPPSLLTPDAMDSARMQNAGDPFVTGSVAPAMPFLFQGSPADFNNARDCLALAAMAEAGQSDEGQRAVIQVILNRVRHPAFAGTVCGVVFEGSQRQTGCQFTFTCDGSLARRYSDSDWAAARARADQALKGYVFAKVGTATHYHTDWVYPSWSPKLEKIAQVETHLFYRWPGRWGTSAAMSKAYRGNEQSFAQLTAPPIPSDLPTGFGDPTEPDAALAVLPPPVFAPLPTDTPKVSGGGEVVMRLPSGKANFIVVSPAAGTEAALANARKLCNSEGTCRVMGWSSRADIPASFPLPRIARDTLQFSYSRDPDGAEIVLYNCDSFPGLPREKCIPRGR